MTSIYITKQGQTWDLIAKKVYGAEKHLDHLMAHNFDLLDHFVFSAGVEVYIPDLPKEDNADLPIWRK